MFSASKLSGTRTKLKNLYFAIQSNHFNPSNTVRCNATITRKLLEDNTDSERKYMRKVLAKRKDCTLYNPNVLISLKEGNKGVQLPSGSVFQSLIRIMKMNNNLDNFKSSHFNEKILTELDTQCLASCRTWCINRKLLALDIWHFMIGARSVKYIDETMKELLSKYQTLLDGVALQTAYYVAWFKKRLSHQQQQQISARLEKTIHQMPLDELSIYCLAFVKSDSKISNPNLVTSMYSRLLTNDLQGVDDIALTGIIKAVRWFSVAQHVDLMRQLQSKLVTVANTAGLMTLTHMANLGVPRHIHNPELLGIIIGRFSENLEKLRIKDMERACLAIATFNFKTTNRIENQFCHDVQNALLQSKDTKFPQSIIRCTSYLLTKGIVDTKLISWSLDQNTLFNAYGESLDNYDSNVLMIDSFAKINLSGQYSGNQLSDEQCERLAKRFNVNYKGENQQISFEIVNILRANAAHCVICNGLPHFTIPDIFFVYDCRQKKTIDTISNGEMFLNAGRILKATDLIQNDTDLKTVAIVVCAEGQRLDRSHRYIGNFQLKLDQLNLLGFHVIVINSRIWKSYAKTEAKQRHLSLTLRKNNINIFGRNVALTLNM